jgi:hypothetical protein
MTDKKVNPVNVTLVSLLGAGAIVLSAAAGVRAVEINRVDEARQSMIKRCLQTDSTKNSTDDTEDIEDGFFESTGWHACSRDFHDCYDFSEYRTVYGDKRYANPGTTHSKRVPVDDVVQAMVRYQCPRTQHRVSRR